MKNVRQLFRSKRDFVVTIGTHKTEGRGDVVSLSHRGKWSDKRYFGQRDRWVSEANLLCMEHAPRSQAQIPKSGEDGLCFDYISKTVKVVLLVTSDSGTNRLTYLTNFASTRFSLKDGRLGSWVVRTWHTFRTLKSNHGASSSLFHCWTDLGVPKKRSSMDDSCRRVFPREKKWSYVLLESSYGLIVKQALNFSFPTTNNHAEYEACIAGVWIVEELGAKKIKVISDSKWVIFQINRG